MQPGIYYDLSNEEYHGGPGISKSQLDDIAINPAIFQWRKGAPEDDEKKAALDMGTALHCLLLEPDEFDKRFIVAPEFNRRTNEGKASEKAFLQDCAGLGMTVMNAEEGRKLKLMRASALAHPAARWLLEAEGHQETSIYWNDDQTGELCRIRPDKFLSGQPVIVDVKKVADIRSVMQKDILNLRIELLNGSYFTGRKMNIEKKGRTAATVNSSMADLKAIFAFAHGNGYIEANPMTGIKPLKKSNKRPDPITREEYPRLIAACSTRQTANMWSLAILTGLRHGEICALAWEDVDLEAKTLTVSRNLTPQGLFTPPKTEAGNRVICLIDAAVDILRDQRELTRMYPQTSFSFHTREYGERIEEQKTFVFNPGVNAVNVR